METLSQASPSSKDSSLFQHNGWNGSVSLTDHLGALTYYRGGIRPQDCAEVRRAGYPESGRYRVYPTKSNGPVFEDCDMKNLNGELSVRYISTANLPY